MVYLIEEVVKSFLNSKLFSIQIPNGVVRWYIPICRASSKFQMEYCDGTFRFLSEHPVLTGLLKSQTLFFNTEHQTLNVNGVSDIPLGRKHQTLYVSDRTSVGDEEKK